MKVLIFLLTMIFPLTSMAQVGFGTSTPNSSSILDVESTTKGFLPPRLTILQRNLINTPIEGLVVYCKNCCVSGSISFYTGEKWRNIIDCSSTDFDDDGIPNIEDIDDDNDGIVDTAEFQQNSLPFTGGDGGSSFTVNQNDPISALIDLTTIDNSFGYRINGNDIHPTHSTFELEQVNYTPGSEIRLVFESDNALPSSPWTANTNSLPRIRITISEGGVVEMYGTRTSTSSILEKMKVEDNTAFNTIDFISGSNSFEIINPDDGGTDGFSGINTVYYTLDSDGDGHINSQDNDADNDGCSDAFESGMTPDTEADYNFSHTDVGSNGLSNSLETTDDSGATTISPDVSDPYNSGVNPCL